MEQILPIIRQYWGYDELRPLQAEAMQAVLDQRDSLVVLPTGGGKSLCFQAPAMHMNGLALVISPLISLMKDQVDALQACGVPAACVNSTLSPSQRRQVADDVRQGRLKLLYLAPERLMSGPTMDFLQGVKLSFVAVDEAHCISQWGHDFRPEYRALSVLKQAFGGIGIHCYTATATPRVRHDIVSQLQLADPHVLVGSFDRPNLVYRVFRRDELLRQVGEVIERHRDESGIIYCIRRADVDSLCAALCDLGHRALPYHAGMADEDRRRNQDAFINDRARIIVATVAFGMGIDKSDVRYVIHAGAPKSLESYQQESGRAGRDGLEAECSLFYTGADFVTWRRLQQDSNPQAVQASNALLAGIEKFCATVHCRHRAILEYFDQELEAGKCEACDVCLNELQFVADPLVIAQKILSCVLRVKERFGAAYVSRVLVGSRDQRIAAEGHDQLSTYGILAEEGRQNVRAWIDQLTEQQFLAKGEYEVLHVTPSGRQLLRGEIIPQLQTPAEQPRQVTQLEVDAWEGVDRGLFEELRALRRRKADERGLAPFIIFSDVTLRDMARRRPSTPEGLLAVQGVGAAKCEQYAAEFLPAIVGYCERHQLATDLEAPRPARPRPAAAARPPHAIKRQAFELFGQGQSLEDVARGIGRAPSTTWQYLSEYLQQHAVCDPAPWVDEAMFERIRQAAEEVGRERLKPIFEKLGGSVSYDQIRIALTCLAN
ncbi:MAG TPA: DNA helicase RecQ, partial [Pirellulales bacterium]